MVSELESLLVPSSTSHEAQWRARILMRSAQDADRDICKRLYEFDSNNGGSGSSSRAQIANRKLHRDFGRAHKQYTTIIEQYEQRQQVEVSFLSSATPSIRGGSALGRSNHTGRLNVVEMEDEDFFDRAMREREHEIKHIRDSVHKVNEIYAVSIKSVIVCSLSSIAGVKTFLIRQFLVAFLTDSAKCFFELVGSGGYRW